MLTCEYKRITYTQEITLDVADKSVKVDGNAIKQFASGGDTIMARKNFKDEVEFKVQSTLLMNCNDLPPITPTDALENMVMLKLPHKFITAEKMATSPLPYYKLRDDLVKAYSEREDVVSAYTWLVLDAFKPTALVMSPLVKADTGKYINNGNSDINVIARRLRFGGADDDATTNEMKDFLRLSGVNMSWDKFVDVLEKHGALYTKNITREGVRGKRGFKHVKILEGEELEE